MPIALTTILIVVPGLGAVAALYPPGRIGLAMHLALAGALGVTVTGLVAFFLTATGALHPVAFFLLLAAVTSALWAGGLRRGSLRNRWGALAEEVRAEPWVLGAGLAILAGFAILRLTFPSELHFSSSTPWRYWADAAEIARAGRFPDVSSQFGAFLPAVTNKGVLSALDAGVGLAIGTEPLPAMAALSWFGSVGLAASLWALGRELGLRLTAALLPLLLVADRVLLNTEITRDLDQFRAETYGRVVAVAALAVVVHSLRTRDRWVGPILAGLLLGVAAAIHMVPVVIALAGLAWYALGRFIAGSDRVAVIRTAAVVAGLAVVASAGLLALAGGDVGLSGAASDQGIAAEFPPGFDPTLFLKTGVGSEAGAVDSVPGPSASHPWSFSPISAGRQYVASAIGLHLRGWEREAATVLAAALLVGGLTAAVAALRRRSALGPVALMAWGLAVTITALAWLFSLRSRFYVPATFGLRRLFDYSSVPIVLAGLALAEAGLARSKLAHRGQVAAVLTLAVGAVLLPTAHPPPASRALVEPFTWLRDHLPCDARVLPNVQTEGVFEALTGRTSKLEGPIPYLRPDVLPEVVHALMEARRYWGDPVGHPELALADFVVVVKTGAIGYDAAIGRPDLPALDRAPNLQPLYRSPAMDVYRVLGPRAASPAPAGFECRRGPIPLDPFGSP